MNPWTQKLEVVERVVDRKLNWDFIRVIGALYPYTLEGLQSQKPEEPPVKPAEVMEIWDKFVASPQALARLEGALIDTSQERTMSQFTEMWFGGNGAYSGYRAELLLDRVRYGLSCLGGMQQSNQGELEDEEEPDWDLRIEEVVQDVAMALLGRRVVIPPEK